MEPSIKDFHHPYKPYDIQLELMNVIYQCIADGKVGILESPTGLLFQQCSSLSPANAILKGLYVTNSL